MAEWNGHSKANFLFCLIFHRSTAVKEVILFQVLYLLKNSVGNIFSCYQSPFFCISNPLSTIVFSLLPSYNFTVFFMWLLSCMFQQTIQIENKSVLVGNCSFREDCVLKEWSAWSEKIPDVGCAVQIRKRDFNKSLEWIERGTCDGLESCRAIREEARTECKSIVKDLVNSQTWPRQILS